YYLYRLRKYSRQLTVSENIDMGKITLQEIATEMDAVVVQAERIVRRLDGFVYLPSGEATTLGISSFDILTYLPGVWINRANNSISINGKRGTRIMVNDRLIRLSGQDLAGYLETIDADHIKSIVVITDPGAQYDANSQGGIIKINTKRGLVQGLKGSLAMNYDFQDKTNPTRINPRALTLNSAEKNGMYTDTFLIIEGIPGRT
ncbi:MAG: hypothetical protein LUD68_09450, partial [Rikenellaceae bacterium]|nr:hypothetical protein [Rikenellaceae bacterium]